MNTIRKNELIGQMAAAIVRWRMTTPAIMLLEANKPFSFIASQMLLIAEPSLGIFVGRERWREWAALLEDRQNVELLLRRLETET